MTGVLRRIKKIWKTLLDILYPRRCPVCDGILPFGGDLVCPECEKRILPVREPRCRKCGKMLRDETAEYCRDCRKIRHSFDRGFSAFLYNDTMQGSIFRFKYKGRREYADYYSREIADKLGRDLSSFRADALVPIPLYKKKQRDRGFNQAEVLARAIGDRVGIPVYPHLLTRVRATRPQKTLSLAERRKNLKRAFKISQNVVELTNVILVDDIYTSGCTMDEAADVLKEAGVKGVYALTLCSGVPI